MNFCEGSIESIEKINRLHYSRICHLLLTIDDCYVEKDFTSFLELLTKYSKLPEQVSRTFFGILYDEMYAKYTTSQIPMTNNAGTINDRNHFYWRALSAILERHLQFEMMPYSNASYNDQNKHCDNGVETICAILRSLVNLNCHNAQKQRQWIHQALQVAQIVKCSDDRSRYPEDEANFIVAKCWNAGVTEAVKHIRFPSINNVTDTSSARVNDGTWYFETAIKFAELCSVTNTHLMDMYEKFRSSCSTTASTSIQDEVQRILNP